MHFAMDSCHQVLLQICVFLTKNKILPLQNVVRSDSQAGDLFKAKQSRFSNSTARVLVSFSQLPRCCLCNTASTTRLQQENVEKHILLL